MWVTSEPRPARFYFPFYRYVRVVWACRKGLVPVFLRSALFWFFLFPLLHCTSCDTAGSLVTEKLYAIWEPAGCVSASLFLSRRFVCQQTEAGSPRWPLNPVMGGWYACKHSHNRLFVCVCVHAKSLKFGKYLTVSVIGGSRLMFCSGWTFSLRCTKYSSGKMKRWCLNRWNEMNHVVKTYSRS